MNTKHAFPLLACMLLSIVTIQTAMSQAALPQVSVPPPTDEPTSTPASQPTPISPWLLMIAVFASVTLSALVISGFQRLRLRYRKKG